MCVCVQWTVRGTSGRTGRLVTSHAALECALADVTKCPPNMAELSARETLLRLRTAPTLLARVRQWHLLCVWPCPAGGHFAHYTSVIRLSVLRWVTTRYKHSWHQKAGFYKANCQKKIRSNTPGALFAGGGYPIPHLPLARLKNPRTQVLGPRSSCPLGCCAPAWTNSWRRPWLIQKMPRTADQTEHI